MSVINTEIKPFKASAFKAGKSVVSNASDVGKAVGGAALDAGKAVGDTLKNIDRTELGINGGGVAYQNGGIYFGSVWDVPVLDSYTSDPGQLDAPGGDIALTVAGRGFSLPVTFELVIDGDPAPLP